MDETDKIETCAHVAHEVNRRYCESIGDYSQVSWYEAPDWQRQSAREGVKNIIADPSFSPEQSHESWMKLKAAEGWTYGDKKDPEAKTHPCMVPYHELPLAQRQKDTLFGAAVRSTLNAFEEAERKAARVRE